MTFIPNPTPNGDHYQIIQGSSGSFLCPPGHPNLSYELRGARRGQIMRNPHTIASVEWAASDEAAQTIPTGIVEQAKRLFETAKLVRSELWERHVYDYFGKGYSPDGVERRADRLLYPGSREYMDKGERYDSLNRGDIVQPDDPRLTPEHHAAYLLVKEYFPDAEPRLDLIGGSGGGYGQKPCVKCGTRLQYEAKVDAFAEPITAKTECPKGGAHQTEE